MSVHKHVLVVLAIVLAASLSSACSKKAGNPLSPSPVTGVVPSVPTNVELMSGDGLTTIKIVKTAPGLNGSAPVNADVGMDMEVTQRGTEPVTLDFTIVESCGQNPGTIGRRSTVFQAGTRASPGYNVMHIGWRVSQPERIPCLRISGFYTDRKVGNPYAPVWEVDVPLNWRLGE